LETKFLFPGEGVHVWYMIHFLHHFRSMMW
jgi:hypothetical protein